MSERTRGTLPPPEYAMEKQVREVLDSARELLARLHGETP